MTRDLKELYCVWKAVFHSCWLQHNIVVASTEVKIDVDLCTSKLVEEVCDQWDQVLILPNDLVEVLEVNTEFAGCCPFFLAKEQVHPGNWDDQMNPLPSISSVIHEGD